LLPNKRKALVIALALPLGIALILSSRPRPQPPRVSFSTLLQKIEQAPTAFDPPVLQIAPGAGSLAEMSGRFRDGTTFTTTGYLDERLLDKLAKANLGYELDATTGRQTWMAAAVGLLPLVVLVLLLLLFMRQLKSGGAKLMGFTNSRAKPLADNRPRVTFADVAGIDEARAELEEIVAFLADPQKFRRLGGRIPKGVLMMGSPGTGKTLLARAIAGEARVPFFPISGSDFVEMFVGVGASRVRSLFEQAKKSAPCIIFIDEIDAVGRHRGSGLGGGHDEREQTLNQLLVEMDGFESTEGVILIAATNRPDVLDPALLRPGRFDRRIVVPRPDAMGRLGILKVHTQKTPLGSDVDLAVVARGTTGFVGADLGHLVNEAALLAARGDLDRLEMRHFEAARDKVLMGPERRSLVVSANDKRMTAYHEAGHTLVAKLTKNSDPIHKVTIIPRGRALGLTQQLPLEDQLHLSEPAAHDQIAFAMGGRVAEELIFGQITTGASNDIQVATDLARKMVCEWGMSPRLGPVYLGGGEHTVFLARDMSQGRDRSEGTAVEIDAEVRRIVTENHERARQLVGENLPALERVAAGLLEYETLDSAEIDLLFAGQTIHRAPPASPVRRGPAADDDVALSGLGTLPLPSAR
jgi:cell division protease FtsH